MASTTKTVYSADEIDTSEETKTVFKTNNAQLVINETTNIKVYEYTKSKLGKIYSFSESSMYDQTNENK